MEKLKIQFCKVTAHFYVYYYYYYYLFIFFRLLVNVTSLLEGQV